MERDEPSFNCFKRSFDSDSQDSVKKKKVLSLSKSRKNSLQTKPKTKAQPAASKAKLQSTLEAKTPEPILVDYACPVCSEDLSSVYSSYLRQRHVEDCLNQNEADDSISDCMFCGKLLSHLSMNTRTMHLNGCLDSMTEQPAGFAGQRMNFLETLSVCPICHDTIKRQLRQKIGHLKQCQKRNKVSISQLVQKFRWIGWGHSFEPAPVVQESPERKPVEERPTLERAATPVQNEFRVSMVGDEGDQDFSDQIVISKANRSLLPKAKEAMDEELQMTLALSKSMVQEETDRRRALKRTTIRDYNSSSVWSVEESKQKAMEKLSVLLFPETEEEAGTPRALGATRFPESSKFFWNLAGNKDLNWDRYLFTSLFVQPFKKDTSLPG